MKRRTFLSHTAGSLVAYLSYSQLYAHVQKEIKSVPIQSNYDVIVLGVGSMGSAACYDLAKKGYRVLGLEQFDIPHELGSHAGQSRIIRKAYAEHPDYVPLLQRAYDNWKTLESETGAELYFKTGLVYFGAQTDPFLKGVQVSSAKYKVPVNKLTEAECSRKYPQFNLPKDFDRLEEPDAGFLPPERCILLFVEQAIHRGAVVRTNEKVLEWKRSNGTITVKTNRGTYAAPKLIITAGRWGNLAVPLD